MRRRIMLAGILVAILCLNACSSQAERVAAAFELDHRIVTGVDYEHVVLAKPLADVAGRLHVYIEGDGRPWIRGRYPATDPSPSNLLALELMRIDSADAVYVGRPCYFGLATKPGCDVDDWTSGRFSKDVVSSMASVINAYASAHDYREIVLIGYSGGGVVARLVAAEIPDTIGVVTIAANLDTNAWTNAHGYLPLVGSVNPAEAPPLARHVRHVQVVGGKDLVVPPEVTNSYLESGQSLDVWHYPEFDHSCCWNQEWVEILSRIEEELKDEPGLDGRH